MQLLWPLETGGRPAHQFLPPHPQNHRPLLVSLPHPTPRSSTQRGLSGPNFPAPSMSSSPKAEVPLPRSPAGLGRSGQAQTPGALRWPRRWRARSEEEEKEEGARRQTAVPPPPPAAQPKLCDKGPGGGGGDEGTPGVEEAPLTLGLS